MLLLNTILFLIAVHLITIALIIVIDYSWIDSFMQREVIPILYEVKRDLNILHYTALYDKIVLFLFMLVLPFVYINLKRGVIKLD